MLIKQVQFHSSLCISLCWNRLAQSRFKILWLYANKKMILTMSLWPESQSSHLSYISPSCAKASPCHDGITVIVSHLFPLYPHSWFSSPLVNDSIRILVEQSKEAGDGAEGKESRREGREAGELTHSAVGAVGASVAQRGHWIIWSFIEYFLHLM